MPRFLQCFDAERMLIEPDDSIVKEIALQAAIEIAMLGLTEECNAVCQVLADYGQFDSSEAGLELQCMWLYSGLDPPTIQDDSDGTEWMPSKKDICQKELTARKSLQGLPPWFSWDGFDMVTLGRMREAAVTLGYKHDSPEMIGYYSLSAHYAAVMHIASDLDRPDVMSEVMSCVAERIHCLLQARYLSLVPGLWEKCFLTGSFREQLSLSKKSIQDYASHVLNAVRDRVQHGPRRPEEFYPNFTIAQLLQSINHNTVTRDGYVYSNKQRITKSSPVKIYNSVLHYGATQKQISIAETRLGRPLPNDIKEFFEISDGCEYVQCEGGCDYTTCDNNTHRIRLPSLNELSFEKEEYMLEYRFELLPKLLDPEDKGPGVSNGAIAMGEHDVEGTHNVFIVGAAAIKRAKEQLQNIYENASPDEKAAIDRQIEYWYGDRKTYDEMTDHCYVEAYYCRGVVGIWPNFRSYLMNLAYGTRPTTKPNLLPVLW